MIAHIHDLPSEYIKTLRDSDVFEWRDCIVCDKERQFWEHLEHGVKVLRCLDCDENEIRILGYDHYGEEILEKK
jgi:hypothetical protein